jgi:Tripartite tricarboxylate transporter TctB family
VIGRRTLETATALLTGAFGLAVVASSFENGIGWSSAGVEAGSFPFLTGSIIIAASAGNLLQGALQARETVISAADLRKVAALFVPAALFIAAIPLIGLYVASAAYVLVAVGGRIPLVRAVALAAVTPLALYVVFERMFRVSLPHGWLGQLLGL